MEKIQILNFHTLGWFLHLSPDLEPDVQTVRYSSIYTGVITWNDTVKQTVIYFELFAVLFIQSYVYGSKAKIRKLDLHEMSWPSALNDLY